jgi:thrombospondin type 3 repeat protein
MSFHHRKSVFADVRWCITGIAALLAVAFAGCEIEETEPNDLIGQATLLRQTESGHGDLDLNDTDFWRTPDAAVGDLIFVLLDSHNSTTSTDAFVKVFANDFTTLIEEDDSDGPDSSAVVAGAVVPQAGHVFYQAINDNAGTTITPYTLYHAIIDPADSMAETEPNSNPAAANPITATLITGNIMSGGAADYFSFHAESGQTIVVIMDEDPDNNGAQSDVKLTVVSPNLMDLVSGDNLVSGDGHAANAAGAVDATMTGTHFVRISDDATSDDTEYRFIVLVDDIPYSDADTDGVTDILDNCPATANANQDNTDFDGAGNACDGCPTNPTKKSAGVCGCGQPDLDIDGDGDIDCGLADPALAMLKGPGLLLIPDPDADRIMSFDPRTGNPVDLNLIPADPTHLASPVAAILDHSQTRILVSDNVNDVVQAYGLNGNYLGVFAPAGGTNLAILDEPRGIALRANGNLLVAVGAGANAHAVAEFNTNGNYVGDFIANGAGGLDGPVDLLHFDGELWVSSNGDDGVHRYSAASGAPAGFFGSFPDFPMQMAATAEGKVLLANVFGLRRGVIEWNPNGNFVERTHAPPPLQGFVGVFELPSGNMLLSVVGAVCEIDRNNHLVDTKCRLGAGSAGFIEFAIQDADGDGVGDGIDNCPSQSNANQSDADSDGSGNACDKCPNDADDDSDGDGKCGDVDNCPALFNAEQADGDGDGKGDACDNCPAVFNADQADGDGNGIGDACEPPPPPPPPDAACGTCAPGVFPVTGLFLPACLIGWRLRRRRTSRAGGR